MTIDELPAEERSSTSPTVMASWVEHRQRAWAEFIDKMYELPDHFPHVGLTNRDHDKVIYRDERDS